MAICSQCGNENPNSAKFCKMCGTQLIQNEEEKKLVPKNVQEYRPLEEEKPTSIQDTRNGQNATQTEIKNKNNLRKRFFAYIIDYFFVMGLFEFINSYIQIRYGPRFLFSTLNLMMLIYFLLTEFKYKNTIGKTFLDVITIGSQPNSKPSAFSTIILCLIKSIPILLILDVLFGAFIKRMDGKFIRGSEKILKVSCENIIAE
jgi:hypothetical protein